MQEDDEVGGERGAVNQEPILIETPHLHAQQNQERRYVLLSSGKPENQSLTQSERNKGGEPAQKAPPPIKTDLGEESVYTRREPSPYSYAKIFSTPPASNRLFADEYFLSPDGINTHTASVPRSTPTREHSSGSGKVAANTSAPRSERSTPTERRPQAPAGLGISESVSSDESDSQSRTSTRPHSTRSASQYSFTKADSLDIEKQKAWGDSAVHGSSRPPPTSSSRMSDVKDSRVKRDAVESKLSRTDTGQSWSPATSRVTQSASTPSSPRQAPFNKPAGVYSRASSYHNEHYSPHPVSPLPPGQPWAPSPPQSRRNSQYAGDSPKEPRSRPGSRPGSRPSSRPPSPLVMTTETIQTPFSPQHSESSRSDTFPPSKKDRTQPVSRLSSLITRGSLPEPSGPRIGVEAPLPARPARILPYPDDDVDEVMPSEEQYRYVPRGSDTSRRPSPIVRPSSAQPTPESKRPPTFLAARPNLPTSYSLFEAIPKTRRDGSRQSSGSDSPLKTAQSLVPLPQTLPLCPRFEHTNKYDDWYTLYGHSTFDVCPDCLVAIVTPAGFSKHFCRAPPRPFTMKTRCEFSSPWTRLAWLLTLKRNRRDLKLVEALADIAAEIAAREEDDCPGHLRQMRTWYGLASIPGFTICSRDKRQLEALLPSLTGIFTRLPKQRRSCALRVESKHFAQYLDMLVEIDDSVTHAREPDLSAFVDLVREHGYKQECSKDNLLLDQTWHFIPELPEFTVCEECYDEVVYPAVKAGSLVAQSFNGALQMPPAARGGVAGHSCQLYSPRMRRVWQKAVASDDFAYLVRKARERKRVEMELQERHAELIRLRDGARHGCRDWDVDPEYLRTELERIAREWGQWE